MQKMSLSVISPAKINLFLHITGRRSDGYHNLQTAFQFLDYGDEIYFERRTDGKIILHTQAEIPFEQNLVFRAAKKLQDYLGVNYGADIVLTKHIPIAAGLGGGSSNCAATLLALNHLWNSLLSMDELAQMGLGLGADVPVFVRGHAAWAEGVGEELVPVIFPECWYAVVVPPCKVSTAEIFGSFGLTRDTSAITINDYFASGGHNDCEAVVFERFPQVQAAFNWLGQFSSPRLTGTGGAVFAAFPSQKEAIDIVKKIPSSYTGFAAKSLNHSPNVFGVSPSGKARGFDLRIPRFES